MSHIIVTETLAKLYEEHGVFDKAKEVYELLHQQHPNRNDLASKVTELESQIVQSNHQTPADYRETLDKGFANDQEGMPLDAALDEFDEKQSVPQFDPEILDQIMVMTDANVNFVQESDLAITTPGIMAQLPANTSTSNELPQIMHRWIDLLMMKRKIDQLKQLKQRKL